MSSASQPHSPSQPATQTNSDDAMGSQLLEETARNIPLSPADCRTLEKILHDVRSPPPLSPTPYSRNRPARSLDAEVLGTHSMYPVKEDRELYAKGCYGHGDEREKGYEDEDDSMELSDVDCVLRGGGDERDGDTVEDVMNLPGKTAQMVSIRDFSALYPRDEEMSDEAGMTKRYRELIEEDLRQQVLAQDDVGGVAATAGNIEEYNDMDIADVKEGHGEDTEVPQASQDEIGRHAVQEEEVDMSELESLEPYTDQSLPSTPSRNYTRRASDASPPRSTSFINFTSNPRAVVQTPNGIHIDFTSSATIPVQSYFTTSKATSPSKRRRKTASPHELAQLAREAAVEEAEADEEAELKELDKYREMDLAPLEPVMESRTAGDLIVFGTPVKVRDEEVFGWKTSTSDFEVPSSRPFASGKEAVLKLDGAADVHHTASLSRLKLPLEQDEDDDADVDESDAARDLRKKHAMSRPHHATFITVVEMLPAAIFWGTVGSAVRYSIAAFDALIERLTGLKMEE